MFQFYNSYIVVIAYVELSIALCRRYHEEITLTYNT
jgi:hypothetical protein